MAVYPSLKGIYPIGIVEEKTGLTSRQIRYYENMGLISPIRTQGKQRRYTEKDVIRLSRIKYLKDNGFDLKSIREKIELLEKSTKDLDLMINSGAVQGRLTSLYPVSNRAVLMKLLEKN
ncbi:MAG: MerR family transcriptional regulator, glutamine synthetase repressor [Thermoanaerobacteraceae bacterium]|jgi:MerR family glutamine synthetase transcriptional repressor|uniref:MerR family transcriptional regulator n=1 Tax=Biomaibacter acetigenes TaxID=2316383 RepID=A0A3G2R973_9FIRM|nr:MerR family transcriptional regulator [Biomaibacter acetigenes]MDK2879916.1 MerR family transcriptional regulator, glutamine synthetase repressor [Thermoanaerobacteraceae bacterium]RKL62851.1 MerR family transcriptional regulator [Thermoanaerobacteraceae bacterium SP2]AYO32030.1 MerR family transcriptional regulator [Biomaibacter acetigenes]MDN5301776.1 MerR family transcriptional regulator, glutamine synthetase repressor [Thermoanaerobacteraceae bacterium]MDN5312558.1 MerR family transcrip